MFAHRGVHKQGQNENTLSSFQKALTKMDGFECDVRLSSDKVPVVIHDETLKRTHNLSFRVNALTAHELRELNVPSAKEVLSLPRLKGKRIILDLKEHERLICRLLSDSINACEGDVMLLSWSDRRPPTKHVVYRATDYRFSPPTTFDGIACKFNGSAVNKGCIDRTLAKGISVNMFAPKTEDQRIMINLYGSKCSYTVKTF